MVNGFGPLVCADRWRSSSTTSGWSPTRVLLTSTLIERLGLERLVDRTVELGDRPGAARPGRKVCSLLQAMALGADSIDDCDVLRSGGTGALLGHRAMAPSTLGTFLRSFTFGHVRQLDRVLAESIGRAWSAGEGPRSERLVIDLDSFIGEVHGYQKQGAGFGYTGERGYHPLIATRSGTGEALHVRQRKGQAGSGRGALRFVQELIARSAGRANWGSQTRPHARRGRSVAGCFRPPAG
jgi:Transposase DDE domain group 1